MYDFFFKSVLDRNESFMQKIHGILFIRQNSKMLLGNMGIHGKIPKVSRSPQLKVFRTAVLVCLMYTIYIQSNFFICFAKTCEKHFGPHCIF